MDWPLFAQVTLWIFAAIGGIYSALKVVESVRAKPKRLVAKIESAGSLRPEPVTDAKGALLEPPHNCNGYWHIEVENTGDEPLEAVALSLQGAVYAECRKGSSSSLLSFKVKTVIPYFNDEHDVPVGNMAPGQKADVYIWTYLPVRLEYNQEHLRVHHKSGSGIVKGLRKPLAERVAMFIGKRFS